MKNNLISLLALVSILLAPIGTEAAPSDEIIIKEQNEQSISTFVGKSKLLKFNDPVIRVAVGDPNVADFKIVSPQELFILGKAVGTTNILLWHKSGKSTLLDTTIAIDLAPLSKALAAQLPNEKDIVLSSASGSVVLSGSVSDAVVADIVSSLAEAHVRNLNRYLTGGYKPTSNSITMPNAATAMVQVVNLLKIRDPQQVMLEVRVAEISKSLLEQLGIQFNGGDIRWNVVNTYSTSGATGIAKLFRFNNQSQNATLEAQRVDSLVKILAEPTIVASSGQEGSFLVGGRVFIPVTQSTGVAGSVVTLVEREYGVGLKFIPTVLDGGRINLKVAPEVSELAKETLIGGISSPTFTTRRVSTSVQLKDGESLVIGGLMRNNVTANIKSFPILGQIPILGALFRSTEFVTDRTELVIVVSPSLVKSTKQSPILPTDKFNPPSRTDLFLGGKLEGKQ